MSPYMRAYEQGIKLAQYKWLSKYANPEQEAPEMPALSEEEGEEIVNNAKQTAAPDQEIPYGEAPTTVGAGDNYRDLYDQLRADAVMRGDASPEDFEGLDYMDMRDAMGARMLMPGDTFDQNAALDRLQNMGEFREGLRQDFENVATSENIPVLDSRGRYADRRMLTQTQQGRNPMSVSPIASDELWDQELANDLGETSAAPAATPAATPAPAPAKSEPTPAVPFGLRGSALDTSDRLLGNNQLRLDPRFAASPLSAPVVAPQAGATTTPTAAPAAPTIEEDPFEDPLEREQRELAMNTFNVQSGGYGKQLRRFRNQFGEGNDDLFTGDDAVNYRQFAQAMDNRGLQVGDTFDARNVIQNLRAMRSNEGPVETPTETSRVGVQRRGRDAGFQTRQQQRAAADRIRAARASAAGNIPQLKTTAMADLPTLAQSPNTQTVELPQRATPTRTPTPTRAATRSLAAAGETPDLSTFLGRADQRVTGRGVNKGRFSVQEGNRSYNVMLDGLSEQQGADIVAGGRNSRKIPTLHGRVDNAFDSLP